MEAWIAAFAATPGAGVAVAVAVSVVAIAIAAWFIR